MELQGSKQTRLRMISSTAIRRRLLAFSAISIIAGWANYDAPKALEILVINRAGDEPGGKTFDSLMGNGKARAVLTEASEFAQRLLYADPQHPIKSVRSIVLCVDGSTTVAETQENVIHLSSKYIEEYPGGVEEEIRGLMYREMGRLWLWDAGGRAPRGLLRGIAEYVRLRAGLSSSELFNNGTGNEDGAAAQDAWDGGGEITALFLGYCESLRVGFVGDLNARLEKGWNESVFEDLLGANVSQIWQTFSRTHPLRHLPNISAASSSPALL